VPHLGIEASFAVLIGFLLGLLAIVLWSMAQSAAPSWRPKRDRIQRRLRHVLEPDEGVVASVRASAGFSPGGGLLIGLALGILNFVFSVFVRGPWAASTRSRLPETVVVWGLFWILLKLALKPRRIVLTDRRFLVCASRFFFPRPGRVVSAEYLGSTMLIEPTRAALSTRLSFWGSRGPMTLWVPAMGRRQALLISAALDQTVRPQLAHA
jgi:hypothetical protein